MLIDNKRMPVTLLMPGAADGWRKSSAAPASFQKWYNRLEIHSYQGEQMPFGIGPGELILVLVVALIVFGPRRLPELGSSLGQAIREFRRASSELTREIREVTDETRPAAITPAATPTAAASTPVVCPGCGAANAEHNKFCAQCGKELGTA